MKEPVLSTYKILKEKAFNADINESWINWAIEMIEVGYESLNLYELAGTIRPYNQFELQVLTNKVFKDLKLNFSDKTKTLENYIYFLLTSNIDKPENYYRVLQEFRDIYYELDMHSDYREFADLYWAKEDLIYSESQWYWIGADRSNIDRIIKEYFEQWIIKLKK